MPAGSFGDTPKAVRIIKRYANRKLYDTQASRYVTLEDIAQLIKDGEDLRVIDNKTKEDLTSVTFTQIVFEEEKRQKRVVPLATLRAVIQSGGEFFQRHVAEPVHTIRTEAERTVASFHEGAERQVGRIVTGDSLDDVRDTVRDLVESTHHAMDDIQRRVDERLRVMLGNVGQFANLGREIELLKKKVQALERRAKKAESTTDPPAEP